MLLSVEKARTHTEASKSRISEELALLQKRLESMGSELSVLKSRLYGKFRNSINLER